MAPETNIGSATPISLGGGDQDEVLGRKVRNDAAAYVRALAEGHGRNGDLAARMVHDAVNVTATSAKQQNLIDVVAPDQDALIRDARRLPREGAEGTAARDHGRAASSRGTCRSSSRPSSCS